MCVWRRPHYVLTLDGKKTCLKNENEKIKASNRGVSSQLVPFLNVCCGLSKSCLRKSLKTE